ALLWIAAVSYVVLWVLYVWRAISHRQAMLHDLRGPEMAFAYFTVVAGTGVLAVRLLHSGYYRLAVPLVIFAAILWFIFGYLLPWQVFMSRGGKPILSRTIGTWFIWAVSDCGTWAVVCRAGSQWRWAVVRSPVSTVLLAAWRIVELIRPLADAAGDSVGAYAAGNQTARYNILGRSCPRGCIGKRCGEY